MFLILNATVANLILHTHGQEVIVAAILGRQHTLGYDFGIIEMWEDKRRQCCQWAMSEPF